MAAIDGYELCHLNDHGVWESVKVGCSQQEVQDFLTALPANQRDMSRWSWGHWTELPILPEPPPIAVYMPPTEGA